MKAVKDERPFAFIRAAQENTAILTALLGWLDSELDKKREALDACETTDEMLRLQGGCRTIKSLRILLGNMAKPKSEVA